MKKYIFLVGLLFTARLMACGCTDSIDEGYDFVEDSITEYLDAVDETLEDLIVGLQEKEKVIERSIKAAAGREKEMLEKAFMKFGVDKFDDISIDDFLVRVKTDNSLSEFKLLNEYSFEHEKINKTINKIRKLEQ